MLKSETPPLARDLMNSNVQTIAPDTPLGDVVPS